MNDKDKKLTIVLLSVSFAMLISGYFFVPFVVHVWTYIANLAGEKDLFLAFTLLIYFVIFSFLGAALGLLLDAYGGKIAHAVFYFIKKIINLILDVTKRGEKTQNQ